MGMIGRIMGFGETAQGVGSAIEGVAEVFTVNKTKETLAVHAQAMESLKQYSAEFNSGLTGWFDSFINGINRLPRPIMALGTVGLFVYAMVDPESFAGRMQGLAFIPDPLWWLLGAIVSFYFGAREMHHFRTNSGPTTSVPTVRMKAPIQNQASLPDAENAALSEWINSKG